MNHLQATLEAILFAAGDAVPLTRLAQAANASPAAVQDALTALASQYDAEQRGIMLIRMANKAQLCSRPLYADAVRDVLETRKPPRLSAAALEVLTIAAYRQPVTRAYIEQLRGVDSGGTIASLADKGLLTEAGRLDVPGRPILYRTTDAFLRVFSLPSLDALPPLPELTEQEQLSLSDSEMG